MGLSRGQGCGCAPSRHPLRDTEDDVHIAYQVVGDGPVDIVFVHAFVSHVEMFWELRRSSD